MSVRFVSICLLLLCSMLAVLGQSDRGTITGTIADPVGAVVPNAPIEAKNTGTGAVFQAASSDTGNYTLAQLPVGNYEISVAVAGFKKYVRENLTVGVAQTLRVDVVLEVGSASESVTVSEQSSLLKTESGEMSHTIQAQRLIDLGLLGIGGTFSSSQGLRFYMTEIQLVPGAFAPGTGFTSGARVNGAPNGTQRTTIDGMDGTNQINAVQAGTGTSVDAIQETAIQTSNFAAEFGQVGGGLFNITMRSGTNQYHGGGFDYLQNEAFNAATPFVNTLPRIRRNDYGYTFGGPVWIPKVYKGKDRTFFFYNKEQFREFFSVNDTAQTVPTENYRLGNFTQALTNRNIGTDPAGRTIADGMIYDPTTVHTVNGLSVRDQFPGNIIPANRFDKVASAIQALIPHPTDLTKLTNNFLPNFPTDRVTTNESVKIDHQLSSKAKISGTWLTNGSGAQFSTSLNGSEGLPTVITQTRGTFSRSMNWRLNYDYTISPTMLWHVGVGSLQYLLDDHSPTTNFDQSSIGLLGAPNPGKRFPSLTALLNSSTGGMVPMGPGVGAAQSLTKQFTPTYGTNLTWVKGNHTYKFGGELRTFGYPLHSLTATNGLYNFSANQTSQLSNCTSATNAATCAAVQSSTLGVGTMGFPYASFLLGLVNTGTVNPPVDLKTGKHFLGFYAQDSWKITRKLSLDYGLRYDYQTYPREQYGRMPTASLAVANPTAGGHPGGILYESTCSCNFAKNYPWAFGPRLGVAYQITPKTVFRAGLGVTYGETATANTGTGSAGASNAFSNPVFGDPAMQLQTGVPSSLLNPWPNLSTGSYPNPKFPTSQNGPASIVDQNAGRPPRQIQWSVGLQREITRNTLVEGSYVANRGAWWLSTISDNYNALTPQFLLSQYNLDINNSADRTILTSQITSSGAGRFQNKLPYPGFSGSVAQSLRPFPQFTSGLSPLWAPQGRTWYDSLQAKVTQRVWHGLEAQYVFTWAKELQQGVEGGTINDVFNRSQNKSISGFSRPYVSTLSLNYRVPAPAGNKIVSEVLRDWAVGATVSYASGLPILAPTSTNNLNGLLCRSAACGTGGTFYDRVPGVDPFLKDLNCHCIDPTKDLVLNKNAWANPLPGQWGTAAPYYNDYRYERRPSESMTLGRVFAFKERVRFTVRMNFTNILNRTQLQNPSSPAPPATGGPAPSTPTAFSSNGLLTGGYGFINYQGGSTFLPPRQGTLEMRLSF
jgi:hypothetical protein